MDYLLQPVYYIGNNIMYFYNSMNPANLSGAIDVIVIEQPDGSLISTPFHVRFGKIAVFNRDDKYVDIQINGEEIDLKMKLNEAGIAHFVKEVDEEEEVPDYLATSPLPVTSGNKFDPRQFDAKRQRAETRMRAEQKRLTSESSSISRSPSPKAYKRGDGLASRLPKVEEISMEERHKKKLPFSSSIFSIRKNRSLPNLKFGLEIEEEKEQEEKQKVKTHRRKNTMGGIDVKKLLESSGANGAPHQMVHARTMPKVTSKRSLSPPTLRKLEIAAKAVANKSKSQDSKPVKFEDSSSGPSTSASSRTSSKEDLSTPQTNDLTPENKDHIADGAVSDSEIDRQRNVSEHEDTEWKWGELPEEKPKEEKPKQEEKQTRWSRWWYWSRKSSPKNDMEEGGVYLDDLMKDPAAREKYFGKSVGSVISTVDSGNGVSLGASPSSPSALSMDSLNEAEDSTPTREEVVRSLDKADAIEHELLAGTDEHATTPSTPMGAAVSDVGTNICPSEKPKERQTSGQSRTSDLGGPLSDDEIQVDIPHPCPVKKTKFLKSLRLDSDQLKSLGLQYGCNEARFSITTKFQGTAWCACHIYLWKWTEKIVISDIDGTITISDVLGHVIPAIGGQWAQPGVAELYTRIKNNGYRMVYLSSRAIGQSHYTKGYLRRIAQGSTTLPDGPVLLSPTSVLLAFRKEVIERRPEEFKIACLSDLKALFPVKQPFYAGFGNRETDVKSYSAVSIPSSRILIIDPSGKVRRADKIGFISSYEEMATETVDYLFPPLKMKSRKNAIKSPEETDSEASTKKGDKLQPEFTKPDKFSNHTHWRTAPVEFAMVDDELAEYEKQRKELAEKNKKEEKTKKKKKIF